MENLLLHVGTINIFCYRQFEETIQLVTEFIFKCAIYSSGMDNKWIRYIIQAWIYPVIYFIENVDKYVHYNHKSLPALQ